MGLASSSGDEFCIHTDKILEGEEGTQKMVDDILIYGKDEKELSQRVEEVLKQAEQHGLTLSKSKAKWGSRIKFAGFIPYYRA